MCSHDATRTHSFTCVNMGIKTWNSPNILPRRRSSTMYPRDPHHRPPREDSSYVWESRTGYPRGRLSPDSQIQLCSEVSDTRTLPSLPPSSLPEPPTLDRSRQILREEEKEEMSLWERPRGPGKDQTGSGAVPLLPGLSAIVDGQPRRAGRREEDGERRRGRGQGKFAEEEPPLSSDRPAGTPAAILGLWEHKFCVCTGAKRSGGLGARMHPSPRVSSCSRHCHLSGKKKI